MGLLRGFQQADRWVILAPGTKAIHREPLPLIPDGTRIATADEFINANRGYEFPWGNLPTPEKASRLWREHRIGMGGLFHTRWFVTTEGRFGGASNVPETLPGSLRSSLLYDGGKSVIQGQLEGNEGFAIVSDVSEEDHLLYRRLQLHAAEHIGADGGKLLVSPVSRTIHSEDGDRHRVYIGFTGRCLTCPNPELISLRQAQATLTNEPSPELAKLLGEYFPELQKSFADYKLKLYPEWEHWTV